MLSMWYCGDISKNIPPYRLLKGADVKHLKGGKQKLSNMKSLVKHVERAAVEIANLPDLVKQQWSPRDVLDLYYAVKHLFEFPSLIDKRTQRFEQLNWKTFYNILSKRKGRLYGEQEQLTSYETDSDTSR